MTRLRFQLLMLLALLPQVVLTILPAPVLCFGCDAECGCVVRAGVKKACCAKHAASERAPAKQCPKCVRIDVPDRIAPQSDGSKESLAASHALIVIEGVAIGPVWATGAGRSLAPHAVAGAPPGLGCIKTTRLVL